MLCDNCGMYGVKLLKITRTYGKGDNLLVVENIPLVVCPHCGESYLTAETLHEIEKIKQSQSTITNQRLVKVAGLGVG